MFLNCNNEDNSFNDKKYYKSIYDLNLFYISICEKYDIFHNVKDFLNNKYINNTIFIEKINYNNSYFNSLVENSLMQNNNFDI